MKLKLMTYNIAAGRVYTDYSTDNRKAPVNVNECIEIIKGEMPDVCGLNEVDRLTERSGGVDQPKVIGEALGYNYYFGKSIPLPPYDVAEYGNAFITRFPILDAEKIAIPEPREKQEGKHYEPRAVIKLKVDIDGREVYFLQTHFGLSPEEQVVCVETIVKLIDELGDKPIVFAGDLNVGPDDKVLAPIRERLFDTGVLREGEYKTYPTHNADNRVLKIDYIFLSSHFKPISISIPDIHVSDHFPYILETEF
ncbi:MAG: endonuclease/exonuclease/phosphatase family protein [Clostridia bacterium]|nr:endonuclease/exonuclease/phosphatase family protein [Clostridia bacterium]